MKIKDLPKEERPMEKILSIGPGALSNTELLALIIKTGSREESAIGLSERLVSSFDDGLRGLMDASPQELMKLRGIGMSKACSLAAAGELAKRFTKPSLSEKIYVNSAGEAAGIFMDELRCEKREHFNCILLDTKGKVIHLDRISVGDLSTAPVHPREVFKNAIKRSASSIILIHNHPSGDPDPSSDDILLTERLKSVGKLVGIKVVDHIIIGDGEFFSFASKGLMDD